MLNLRLSSPWYRSARHRSTRTALIAVIVACLPACNPGKTADSAGMVGSSSNATSTTSLTDSSSETAPSTGIASASTGSTAGTGTDTSSGATTTATTSGSTSGPAWPPAECGDVVCGEGKICVVDWYWDCCTFQVASTGTSTDGGTTASTGGSTDPGTTTGEESTSGSTTWDSTTGCRADTVTTYECKILPPACSLDDPWLLQCLSNAFCYLGFLGDSFADGYLYCPGPAHGCY